MNEAYFASLANRQRELKSHGFDAEPSDEELVDYAFGLDDKLSALCNAIGVRLVRDVCGRWVVVTNGAEGARW